MYDAHGRLNEIKEMWGAKKRVQFVYDDSGQKIEERIWVEDNPGWLETFEYIPCASKT